MRVKSSAIVITIYLLFLLIPIYWLINMSLKTNMEITSTFTLYPHTLTFQNYTTILTDPSWYNGYINSIIYVTMNVIISLAVALPAAYAFSRYSFMGDKHLFFWLLTNRMAPPAVFALPFFQLYSSVGLFDTHIAIALAHCLFNVPLAVWILEGFMRGVPKEIDETAYIDGYSFGRFFVKIFMPLIASGIGVTAFFCFMFSWVELLLSRTLATVNAKSIAATMTRTVSASGMDWGVLAAAGVLTIIPGALVVYFVRNYIAKGFALGEGVMTKTNWPVIIGGLVALMLAILAALLLSARTEDGFDLTAPMIEGGWMAWTPATALFFWVIGGLLMTMTVLAIRYPETPRVGILRIETTRGDRLFISLLGSAFLCIAYLAVFGPPLWGALILCLIYAAAVFRWV